MKLRVIITGGTGMVGEGVLLHCLQSDEVEAVLAINRRPTNITHPKLKEIVHGDFMNVSSLKEQMRGYNACFFCLGVSSVGIKEEEYTKLTYTLTMHFATVLSEVNTDTTFCYVSGASTDSTEKGRLMWARVKGKTENDLQKLPFKAVYLFRPGLMKPVKGQKRVLKLYSALGWLFPVIKFIFPNSASTINQVANAMIHVSTEGYEKRVLEVKDINAIGNYK